MKSAGKLLGCDMVKQDKESAVMMTFTDLRNNSFGFANLGAGLSQGFVVDASMSRSSAADQAGVKSQMSSIIFAGIVLVTIVALTPLFRNLPEATLGAIVIHAVWHVIDFSKLSRLYKIRRDDFWTAAVALMGVLVLGILPGLLVAVFLSLLLLLYRIKTPSTVILGSGNWYLS